MRRTDSSEFYKGKRKKAAPAFIVSIIVLALIAFVILLFYGLQKYIVITNDGLRLDIPLLREESAVSTDGEKHDYKTTDAELVVGEPDYSNVKATAGEELSAVNGVYVTAENVTAEALASYAQTYGEGSALVLEVKPASGLLVWNSQNEIAVGYGTAGQLDLAASVSQLKEKGIYLVASVSCLTDNMLASRYPQMMLMHADGSIFTNEQGSWIDPYNGVYTDYIISLCKELDAMGFDEILLTNVRLPSEAAGAFMYGSATTGAPTPLTAVSGFALDIARGLKRTDVVLSVQLNSETALQSGEDSANGQNLALLMKVYDRVYCNCTLGGAAASVSAAARFVELGDANMRLVPMVYAQAPETSCWVVTS